MNSSSKHPIVGKFYVREIKDRQIVIFVLSRGKNDFKFLRIDPEMTTVYSEAYAFDLTEYDYKCL